MIQSVPDEATIVSYLQREDAAAERAIGWIVDVYGRRLYTFIKRWSGSHELTNDILQDTLVLIWRKRDQFQGNSSLFSWMYRIAYNETLQTLRREQKHRAFELGEAIVGSTELFAQTPSATPEQLSAWLMEAVDSLPEKQRIVFELKYFEDLKYEEIAAVTKGSVGGLKANYFHAVQKIEAFLIKQLNH